MSLNGWSTRTLLFADGRGGSAMQIHVMCWDEKPTPILMIWSRKSRTDPGSRHYWFKDLDYTDFQKCEFDWVRSGRPMGDEHWPADPMAALKRAEEREADPHARPAERDPGDDGDP